MVDKVLEGKKAEAMLVGIPVLMIVLTVMVRISMRVVNKVKKAMKASPSHWDSEDIIVHGPEGHEHHITVDEALDAVMIQSERKRRNSMMGMLGLDPNKLEFDYEKHFPEHELPPDLPMIEEDSIPSGVNLKPRPSQSSLLLKWSQDRMAEAEKNRLGRRHSVAVRANDCGVSGVVGKHALSKKERKTSLPRTNRSFKRQRSVSCSPCTPEDLAQIREEAIKE